jgi:hypothetical protein
MPAKEGKDWFFYIGLLVFIGLLAAGYYFGWLDGLTAWFNETLRR